MNQITVLTLPLPLRSGTVNCYLVETSTGFLLIDTGASNQRAQIGARLAGAGCEPGSLQLIILTHGDFDHIGNASHLRQEFRTQIAMHQDDAGMAEHADMFWNRSSGSLILRRFAPLLFRFLRSDRFVPDLCIDEGFDLSEYGLDAHVLSLPGHSKGSIGVLTADGDLFCGDLLENTRLPSANSIMDDPVACETSIAKLRELRINTIYPGHGNPFPVKELLAIHQELGQGKEDSGSAR